MTTVLALIAAITGLVTALGGATGIVLIIKALRGQTAAVNAQADALAAHTAVMERSERTLSALAYPVEGTERAKLALAYVRDFVAENAAARALWAGLGAELGQPGQAPTTHIEPPAGAGA